MFSSLKKENTFVYSFRNKLDKLSILQNKKKARAQCAEKSTKMNGRYFFIEVYVFCKE